MCFVSNRFIYKKKNNWNHEEEINSLILDENQLLTNKDIYQYIRLVKLKMWESFLKQKPTELKNYYIYLNFF